MNEKYVPTLRVVTSQMRFYYVHCSYLLNTSFYLPNVEDSMAVVMVNGVIDILSFSRGCTLHWWNLTLQNSAYIHSVSILSLQLSVTVWKWGLRRKLWRHQSGTKCLHHSRCFSNVEMDSRQRQRERGTTCHRCDQSWNPIQGAAFPECWLRRSCRHNWEHSFMSQADSGAERTLWKSLNVFEIYLQQQEKVSELYASSWFSA